MIEIFVISCQICVILMKFKILMFFRFEGPMGRIHSETYVSLDMPEMGEWEVIHPRLRKKEIFHQKIAF